MIAKKKIELLRTKMKAENITAYIIPTNDPHNSEYLPEYFKSRQWLSGFTGSAGTLVVTDKRAGLWTDGRYFTQAENQLEGSGIELFKMRIPGFPTVNEFLSRELKPKDQVGLDGSLFTVAYVDTLKEDLSKKDILLTTNLDLIQPIWLHRPEFPQGDLYALPLEYCGLSTKEKLEKVTREMEKYQGSHYLLNTLADIAYLLNLRGHDIHCNPFFMSFLIIEKDQATLFMNMTKLNHELCAYLQSQNVSVKDYTEIEHAVELIPPESCVLYDSKTMNYELVSLIRPAVEKKSIPHIVEHMKAIKNETEQKSLEVCQIHDGIAMLKFMAFLDETVKNEALTEIDAENQLEAFRSEIEGFKGISFDTIAGYKDHAAMMHYKATDATTYTLKPEHLFLVDSGGQYLTGTTDITRTFALGPMDQEEKEDYTLVLKGHIGLARAIFLEGTTGANLDILARQDMWRQGIDYKCGTGHGVGFLAGVHEGPQGISSTSHQVKLEPGMILTNEPGIYRPHKHGIRIENTMIIRENQKTEFGTFYRFDTISYCPIDTRPLIKERLTPEEILWLNDYHKMTYDKLYNHCPEDLKAYLKAMTQPI